ncbi:hypothetical protein N2152v2_006989 [Parachlorella kessleri]
MLCATAGRVELPVHGGVRASHATMRSVATAAGKAILPHMLAAHHHVAPTRSLGFPLSFASRRSTAVRYLTEVAPEPQPSTSPAPPVPLTPAQSDSYKFEEHWSVDMWRDLAPRAWFDEITADGKPLNDRMQLFMNTLNSAVSEADPLRSTEATAYWGYHLARSGFFLVQAIAGLLAAQAARAGASGALGAGNVLGLTTQGMTEMLSKGWIGPATEALLMYFQDLENIREGRYKLPWDMVTETPTHRQYNPLFVLSKGAALMRESAAILSRKAKGRPEPVWLKSELLPKYFQNTFHFQTDGWLSQRSAQVYENSTETLFLGRQDAMQRSTLVPISDFMKGKDPGQMKALEVACGTGRFATFVKDNYPTMDLTLLDLSPFYLAEARNNMAYWKRKRAADKFLGGVDGNGTTFMQGAAESIAAPDASYDVVYSVYLLHELPPKVRKQAIHEMARVLKPGGMLVLTDSYQLGDRTALDDVAGKFGDFNEPYYRSYIATDLGGIAEEAGLVCGTKVLASTSKTLSFTKPLPLPATPVTASIAQQVAVSVTEVPAPPVDPLSN